MCKGKMQNYICLLEILLGFGILKNGDKRIQVNKLL